jgi:hypothetical protein
MMKKLGIISFFIFSLIIIATPMAQAQQQQIPKLPTGLLGCPGYISLSCRLVVVYEECDSESLGHSEALKDVQMCAENMYENMECRQHTPPCTKHVSADSINFTSEDYDPSTQTYTATIDYNAEMACSLQHVPQTEKEKRSNNGCCTKKREFRTKDDYMMDVETPVNSMVTTGKIVLHIMVPGDQSRYGELHFFDAVGREIKSLTVLLHKGDTILQYNSELPNGVYFMKLLDNGGGVLWKGRLVVIK